MQSSGGLRVVRAEAMGMCFGVRDALELADRVADPATTTVYGELVHNAEVLDRLHGRGLRVLGEADRDRRPATRRLMITAHGISNSRRRRLLAAGHELIDTTCPLVQRVHDKAQSLADNGAFVVLIGKPGHVEVQGIVEDLPVTGCTVVAGPADAQHYAATHVGVLAQTTMPKSLVEGTLAAIRQHNPTARVEFEDTVCEPTKKRIAAVEMLAKQVDVMVVVGGANSNNTRALARLAEQNGCRARQVAGAAELCEEWFHGVRTVGLTAGTSALAETVDEVEACLMRIGRDG